VFGLAFTLTYVRLHCHFAVIFWS